MTHIFTRRQSGLFAPDHGPIILPDQGFGIGGSIVATLRRPKTGTPIEQWRFRNKIVDTYANLLMTNTAGFPGVGVETDSSNFFAAGTGTTAPAAANTTLVAEIASGGRASTTNSGGYTAPGGGAPDYCWITRHAVFSTAQANGTIGEFGWFDASSGGGMRARAVPKDATGTQITINKTSAATLTVDWSFWIFLIQADSVISRTISGQPYTITIRALGANATNPLFYILSRGPNWAASLGARVQAGLFTRTTSAASSSPINASSVDAYVPGSYTRTLTYTLQNGLTAFAFLTNTGGSNADAFANIQMGFSPAIVGAPSLKVRVSLIPA